MFDFSTETTDTLSSRLSLLVAGPSGAGKSHLIGTYPGKILYLTAGGEIHGVDAARKTSKNVTAVSIDRDKNGPLSADDAVKRFIAATDPAAVKKSGFELVVFDGLTELEKVVRATNKWKNMCEAKGGTHNSFAETPATLSLMDTLLNRLRNLQFDLDLDLIVTCILDVTDTNNRTGEIEAAKPRLQGYQVAESMIQQFGDIVIIGLMKNAEGVTGRVLQMQGELGRQSVDIKTQEVKKFFGITPRLAGVENVPPFIKADLTAILKLKGR